MSVLEGHSTGAGTEGVTLNVNNIIHPPVLPTPTTPNRPPGKMTNQLKYLKDVVLKAVGEHIYSWPFEDPVDTKMLKLHDYHKIIKTPMDLTTINDRLKDNYYHQGKECISDFMTMVTNTYSYYKPGDYTCIMARTIEEIFLRKLADMPQQEIPSCVCSMCGNSPPPDVSILPATVSPPITVSPPSTTTPAVLPPPITPTVPTNVQTTRRHPKMWKKVPPNPPNGQTTDKESRTRTEKDAPVSMDVLHTLASDMLKLPDINLGRIIDIINMNEPNYFSDTVVDQLEIDFEKLNPSTVRLMMAYITTCNKKTK